MNAEHAGRALRFLLTDRCNLRCTYCHNEFQGNVAPGRTSRWNPDLIDGLIADAGGEDNVRIKVSGGEPLVRWSELTWLLAATRRAHRHGVTLFTNLTLASERKLAYLRAAGVTRINANLPSFRPVTFGNRAGCRPERLKAVLANARTARRLGIRLQLNLVLPSLDGWKRMDEFLEAELGEAMLYEDAWDGLSLVADDWLDAPASVQERVTAYVVERADVAGADDGAPPRSRTFRWAGKQLLSTRCTNWSIRAEREQADVYVVPPGRPLASYVRGRAYRER